jgi:steroid 5-alpha reductase family enzyme
MVPIITFVNLLESLTDFREIIRKRLGPTLFFLFNVTFISFVQNVLLFLITTPTYVMLLASRFSGKMATADIISARVIMGLILVAFFADQQQWGTHDIGAEDFIYLTFPK